MVDSVLAVSAYKLIPGKPKLPPTVTREVRRSLAEKIKADHLWKAPGPSKEAKALLSSCSNPVAFYILEEAGVRDPLGEWLNILGALFSSSCRQVWQLCGCPYSLPH